MPVAGARMRRRAIALLGVVALLGSLGLPAAAGPAGPSTVPSPTVEGPIPREHGLHGRPQTDHTVRMDAYGYVEEEYFVTGMARHVDDPGNTAGYTTRFIVRRPAHHRDFNGTVIVEWNNVTAQHDQTPDWYWSRPMVLREGFAYVIVSAQAAGHCCAPLSLQNADPIRYAEMNHPGDSYSFDIFSQVVQALRRPAGVNPMGGLTVRQVLATGHSQSASRLHTYVSQVQPTARVIDGFLIDGGGSKQFPADPAVPVIHLLEEFGFSASEPNVSRNYRLWEVAGAAHADYWILRQQFDAPERATPQQPQHDREWGERVDENAGNYGYARDPRELGCATGGSMFPKRYAVSAALYRLDEWARTSRPAPALPRVEYDDSGSVVRDELGHARGGLRLPVIDVPIVRYDSDRCVLFGNTYPLDPLTLAERYPTHDDYVEQMQAATDRAVAEGILLPADAEDLMRRARSSAIPQYQIGNPLPPLP